MRSFLRPSINWLLVFVPVAIVLRIWPQVGNETALFICSCFAVILWRAGWDVQPRNSPNIWATESEDC